jgi:membrane glycosyltransferase
VSDRPGSPPGGTLPAGLAVERLLEPWQDAHERARQYAERVGRSDAVRLATSAVQRAAGERSWPRGAHAIERTVEALRSELAASAPLEATRERSDVEAAPRIARRSMASRELHPSESVHARRRRAGWVNAARRRRGVLALLIFVPATVASYFMSGAMPAAEGNFVRIPLTLLFGALFGWISFGFWTALAGALVLLRGDRYAISRSPAASGSARARTALVMPICEEPVERVFAGLRATQASIERAGGRDAFDFFVLSDSSDPDTCAREQLAWARLCRDVDGFGRIFYRRRKARLNRKSGNIADFLRRWGSRYRYFVVLDADSVMSGEALRRLVGWMEARPDVAAIQSVPAPFGRRSLFGRVTQFAARLQTPMFAAGLHFWQLGDIPYWGHNAILRTEPFMEFAALPRLRGRPPFGGAILSHDFVEAALLGRAGHSLWLAFDLAGSFEETPATLLEEMRRDRRWCQGNMQHLRLLFEDGFFTAHRALFLNGAFSYVSALLWLAFLALGTANALALALRGPVYFPETPVLYPEWPVWHPEWAPRLVAAAGVLLFAPKLLALVLVGVRSGARSFGGFWRLCASVLLEASFAALLAPIRMTFHARFVLSALAGRSRGWPQQERGDIGTPWRRAASQHGFDTLAAALWAFAVLWLDPSYFPWLAPVLVALVLSIPTSVLSSRASLGQGARRLGLFVTPEEIDPPRELADVAASADGATRGGEFVYAIVDPAANAALRGMARSLREKPRPARATTRAQLERALLEGPQALDAQSRRQVLDSEALLAELHDRVWTLRSEPASVWGLVA